MTSNERSEILREDHDRLISLEVTVRKQGERLDKLEDKLERGLERIENQLASSMHEFNDRLTPILTFVANTHFGFAFLKWITGAAFVFAVVWNTIGTIAQWMTGTMGG